MAAPAPSDEETFVAAFVATPLVQTALQTRGFAGAGAEASRLPRSLHAVERRWFAGCAPHRRCPLRLSRWFVLCFD
jgi:hypothetical protein